EVGGVAVEESGVYVVVWTDRVSGFVHKYTAGGDELWVHQVDTGAICECSSTQGALAADSTGVYVASTVVSKLDLNGNTLWKRRLSKTDDSNFTRAARVEAKSVALDATGHYVTGGTGSAFAGQCTAGPGDSVV